MRRADIISDVETIANVGSTYRNQVIRALQHEGLWRYATMYPWPHYRDTGYITTVAPYTTGSVDATNGSTTLTGNSTTFTRHMVGRKVRVGTDTAFYEIAAFVSTTELTLAAPYQGTSTTSSSYSLFKDEYRLPADCYKPLNLRQLEDGVVMLGLSYQDLDFMSPDLDFQGDPLWVSVVGRRADTYTTGTLAVTSGTKTLTGTGTEWTSVDGLGPGSRIAVTDTSEVFTVKSVDSATSITIYESPSTTDASASYIAKMDNIVVQVNDVPDAARSLYLRYHRIPAPLVNDYDEPDMPESHHYFLVWATVSILSSLLGRDTVARQQEDKFLRLCNEQWLKLSKTMPYLNRIKDSMDVSSQPNAPRYPSNYGVPLGI